MIPNLVALLFMVNKDFATLSTASLQPHFQVISVVLEGPSKWDKEYSGTQATSVFLIGYCEYCPTNLPPAQ